MVEPVVTTSSTSRTRRPDRSSPVSRYTPWTLARRAASSSRWDWGAVVRPLLQQLPGRESQLPGRRPGQQLRLIKAPFSLPPPAQRGPGHHIHPSGQAVLGALSHEKPEGLPIAGISREFVPAHRLGHPVPVGQGRETPRRPLHRPQGVLPPEATGASPGTPGTPGLWGRPKFSGRRGTSAGTAGPERLPISSLGGVLFLDRDRAIFFFKVADTLPDQI